MPQYVHNVPNGWAETFSGNLTLSKNDAGFRFHGPATITLGAHQLLVSSGVTGAFVAGASPPGGTSTTAARFVYTGTGTAISVGGSGNTIGLRLENFAVDISGAGSSAIGIDLAQVNGGGSVYGLLVVGSGGSNTQVGIQIDPGANFSGDFTLRDNQVTAVQTGFLLNSQTEEITFLGDQVFACAASGKGIDFEGSGGVTWYGGNIHGCATGVNFGGISANNFVETTIGGATTTVSAGASTIKNFVRNLSTDTMVISDSGTLNRFVQGAMGPGLLNQQGAAGAITGNASDQNIYTYTLPANILFAGKGLRIRAAFNHSTGTASTTYKIIIGGTTLKSFNYANPVSNNGFDVYDFTIFNNSGSQTAQNWFFDGQLNVTGQSALLLSTSAGTGSINFVNQQAIQFTFNVANTDQITPEFFLVELVQ